MSGENEKERPGGEDSAALGAHVIFHGLTPDDLEVLGSLVRLERFEAGEAILEEATTGNALYVIVAGAADVVICCTEQGGKEVRLAELKAGDCFGEMELLDTMVRSASVVARETTECAVLTTGALYQLRKERPDAYEVILINIARELSRRLRESHARILELSEGAG